jgi:hypothetical protein
MHPYEWGVRSSMEEQEQQISNWSQSVRARIHIFAYIAAFIFLYIEGGKLSNTLIQAVGILFLVPAFLILIGQLRVSVLKRIAKFADDVSAFPMYVIAITFFITQVFDLIKFTERVELLWAIPAALAAIIVYDIIDIVKGTKEMARVMGKKATAIRQLKVLAFVLMYFMLFALAFDVQGIGKPIFWLTPAVISLTIALYLDGTFKK